MKIITEFENPSELIRACCRQRDAADKSPILPSSVTLAVDPNGNLRLTGNGAEMFLISPEITIKWLMVSLAANAGLDLKISDEYLP